jgi:nitroreductase
MDVFEAIYKRRSVRNFTGDPIPREDLEKIVDAGRLAPSGNNLQPWEFIVVTDRCIITEIKSIANWIENASAVIAVVMDSTSRWWIEDGSAAVENMMIACTALGYGSCWLEGYTLLREEPLKMLLGIPANRRLMTLVPIGVAKEWPEKEKKPLGAVIRWEKY